MSDFNPNHPPDWWETPPFTIDESPDDLSNISAGETLADPALPDLSALHDAVAGLQSSIDRFGRELYKNGTRVETLLTQVTRLRSDVSGLAEANPSDDKARPVLKAVLPLLDGLRNIDAAVRAAADGMPEVVSAELIAPLRQAVAIVREKSLKVLRDLGVTEMDSVGKPYDAHRQVVVDIANNPDLPALQVLEEETKGYLYRDQVLRPAQVIVNKPPAKPAPTASAADDSPAAAEPPAPPD